MQAAAAAAAAVADVALVLKLGRSDRPAAAAAAAADDGRSPDGAGLVPRLLKPPTAEVEVPSEAAVALAAPTAAAVAAVAAKSWDGRSDASRARLVAAAAAKADGS